MFAAGDQVETTWLAVTRTSSKLPLQESCITYCLSTIFQHGYLVKVFEELPDESPMSWFEPIGALYHIPVRHFNVNPSVLLPSLMVDIRG